MVIGLGSGVTAGAVACHPSLKHLDVVEISPEVRKAARLFADHNRRVLDDPRVRVVIEDAKSFMKITDRRYDVIVSEPSNPWMAGVAGVFTEEFYQSCKERMAPHGVMVQWVHAYDFSNEAFDIVLATFGQVFPRFGIWQAFARDILLVGTTDAFPVDLAALESRMNNPVVKADLARVQLTCVPLLLAQELISQDNGPSIAASDARVHSDFYPVLEYVAQRDFFARPLAERWRQLDETFSRRSPTLLVEYLKTRELGEDDYKAFAEYFFAEERQYVDLFYTVLMRWQKEHPDSLEPVRQTTRFNYLATPAELEVLRMAPDAERVMAQGPQHTQFLRKYGLFLMRRYHEQRSVLHQPSTEELEKVLARLIELDPENQRTYRAYLAELAWERGDDEQCLELGKLAFGAESGRQTAKFALDPSSPLRLAAFMAEILWRRGEYDEAAILCDEIIQANFLGSQSRGGALLFEATRRKILRSMASAVNQSRNTAPASASGGKSGP